jgi:hypothetical protein
MPRFAIAFVMPSGSGQLTHRVIEGENKDTALRSFFNESVSEYYSNDEQGFHYFKEDFFDESAPGGSIIEV